MQGILMAKRRWSLCHCAQAYYTPSSTDVMFTRYACMLRCVDLKEANIFLCVLQGNSPGPCAILNISNIRPPIRSPYKVYGEGSAYRSGCSALNQKAYLKWESFLEVWMLIIYFYFLYRYHLVFRFLFIFNYCFFGGVGGQYKCHSSFYYCC